MNLLMRKTKFHVLLLEFVKINTFMKNLQWKIKPFTYCSIAVHMDIFEKVAPPPLTKVVFRHAFDLRSLNDSGKAMYALEIFHVSRKIFRLNNV